MSGDMQHLSVFFYVLCFEIIITNSRTSHLWRLSDDKTKIVEVQQYDKETFYTGGNVQFYPMDDPLFQILSSTEHIGDTWVKRAPGEADYCTDCRNVKSNNLRNNSNVDDDDFVLDCGKAVNFTYYDNLVGVMNRKIHPKVPEPEAIYTFSKKMRVKNENDEYDLTALEKRLKKLKKEKPKSVQMYNQIGQFWRVKGDAARSIECFRKVLAATPYNSETLLNLARVLFALQYLDDAIFLTRKSMEYDRTNRGLWQQYFTLGEIFKAYGHYQEAIMHLEHVLTVKPGFQPAIVAIKEMRIQPLTPINTYTAYIIAGLVFTVCVSIFLTSESNTHEECEVKPHRHFSKATAMRSLRFGVPQKRKRGNF